MRHILLKISQQIVANDHEMEKYRQYAVTRSTPGWSAMQEWLLLMRGLFAEHMLSENFTKLNAAEKDVHQRAYAMGDELIRFLLDPLAGARKRMLLQTHNQRMTGTAKVGPGMKGN